MFTPPWIALVIYPNKQTVSRSEENEIFTGLHHQTVPDNSVQSMPKVARVLRPFVGADFTKTHKFIKWQLRGCTHALSFIEG